MKILVDIAKGGKLDLKKYQMASVDDLEEEIKKIVEKNKGASMGAIMGEVMKKYRGQVDGKKINEIVKRLL